MIDILTLNELQRHNIEEADSRIVVHAMQACKNGESKIVVLSSDTDVVVLLLHYWMKFEEKNLMVCFA